jgi:type I restriction enzyme, S subunit
LVHGIERLQTLRFGDAPSRARKPVRNGDVLISTVRTYLKAIALIDGAAANWVASTGFAVCRPSQGLESRCLYRAVQSIPFVESIVASSTGVSYPAITPSALGNLRIPVPNLAKQKAIADFLDRETARIDHLIEKKQRLVELLEEREISLLEVTVKGQQEGRELVESGVEWIGQIPGRWRTAKITQVARLESGHTPSRSEDAYWVPSECTIPWFTLADIWQVRRDGRVYVRETKEKISPLGLANSAARLLPAATVILSRTASVGFPAILGVSMATTQDFVNWICGPLLRPKFLYYALRAMRREFSRLMMGSTHQTIYMPDVRSFKIPLPPIDEQDEAIEKLDSILMQFKVAVQKTETSVDRLNEFRSSLITAAVTGQMDLETWGKHGQTDRRLEAIEELMEQQPEPQEAAV